MCEPTSIVMVGMAAASMVMGISANNAQAEYQTNMMEYQNKVLEQERQLAQDDINAAARQRISQATAANPFMDGMPSTGDTAGIDVARQAGRDKYVNSLRVSMQQGMNNYSAANAQANAKTKNLQSMFNFGKSVAMSGVGSDLFSSTPGPTGTTFGTAMESPVGYQNIQQYGGFSVDLAGG